MKDKSTVGQSCLPSFPDRAKWATHYAEIAERKRFWGRRKRLHPTIRPPRRGGTTEEDIKILTPCSVHKVTLADTKQATDGNKRVPYFSDVLIVPKFVFSLVPTPWTAAMIAMAIPAAISPYSMAVAPDSSLRNRLIMLILQVWTTSLTFE